MSASEDRALKAHHSTAQGQALGHMPSILFPSPERATLLGFALTGLIAPFHRNPGLCPGLSNDAPLGPGTSGVDNSPMSMTFTVMSTACDQRDELCRTLANLIV